MIRSFKKSVRAMAPRFYNSYLLKNGKVVNSEISEMVDVLI